MKQAIHQSTQFTQSGAITYNTAPVTVKLPAKNSKRHNDKLHFSFHWIFQTRIS